MDTKKVNVLLVDDDEINQLVACTFLRKWDVAVTIAKDGTSALELIQSKNFQLVMMDLQMPEMDGYECTKRIRALKDPYYKNVPIIVFSASYIIDSKQKAMEHGMTDFMNKPFRQEELREKLGQYVDKPLAPRPLKIDFDLHTDGDPVFKVELMQLLGENVLELKKALKLAVENGDQVGFAKTFHKVSSAITILNDAEFTQAIETVRLHFKGQKLLRGAELQESADKVGHLGDAIMRSIEHEMKAHPKSH